jgi:hypothetical protein
MHPNTTTGEYTITCILRPDDLDSYHHKWQGLDSRTRDWDLTVKRKVEGFLWIIRKITHGKFQYEFEHNPDHLHQEWDDNSL